MKLRSPAPLLKISTLGKHVYMGSIGCFVLQCLIASVLFLECFTFEVAGVLSVVRAFMEPMFLTSASKTSLAQLVVTHDSVITGEGICLLDAGS